MAPRPAGRTTTLRRNRRRLAVARRHEYLGVGRVSPDRSAAADRTTVEIDGRQLSLSNLDKVMYPEMGFTKAEVIDYYRRIAPVMVPHLAGRPITLKRYPNGVEGQSFFEKNCPSHRPEWVGTIDIESSGRRSGRNRSEIVHYCQLDSAAHLVWTANLAAIELHPGLQTCAELGRPTWLVFDLDPGPGTDEVTCAHVACLIRDILDHLGLVGAVKTSGSKGLQLYVPLNVENVTFDDTRDFALALGQVLERAEPETRHDQHGQGASRRSGCSSTGARTRFTKTTIAVYSLRARPRPTVSTPLTWDEVDGRRVGRGVPAVRRRRGAGAGRRPPATCSQTSSAEARSCRRSDRRRRRLRELPTLVGQPCDSAGRMPPVRSPGR